MRELVKVLDLFCCCGGISKGFANNGFDVTGVDITDGHSYPFKFYHRDVFDLSVEFLSKFDIIHASPPCQHYSFATRKNRRENYPDLIDKVRNLLIKTGKKYIMENVPNAPLRKDLILCGEMFGLRVIRHRVFEINGFDFEKLPHPEHKKPVGKKSYYMQVAGHGGDSYSYKIEDWKRAMGIDWVCDKEHLVEMIPPLYSQHITKLIKS